MTAQDETLAKQEWSRHMRILFSPAEMLLQNGAINHDYFRPKRSKFVSAFRPECLDHLNWQLPQQEALYQGLLEYGTGEWTNIIVYYLPNWDAQELAERTCKLLGLKSIKELHMKYKNWKGSKQDIAKERRANLLQQGITEEELEAMEIDSGFVNMKTTEDAYITKMNSKSDGHSIIVTKKKVLKNKNNQTVRLKRKRGEQEGSKPRASRSKHNDDDNSDDNDNEGFVTVKSLRQRTVAALYNTLDSSDESPSERKGSDDEDFEL